MNSAVGQTQMQSALRTLSEGIEPQNQDFGFQPPARLEGSRTAYGRRGRQLRPSKRNHVLIGLLPSLPVDGVFGSDRGASASKASNSLTSFAVAELSQLADPRCPSPPQFDKAASLRLPMP